MFAERIDTPNQQTYSPTVFTLTTLEALKQLIAEGPAGNRWFKVNLHVHGEKNDPGEIVSQARAAGIDLIAITDHQSFGSYDAIAAAASATSGRPLTVLPGIEITSLEGVHILAIFPVSYSQQTFLLGWLEITGSGDTRAASPKKLGEIFDKVQHEGGIVIVPHPFTQGIGFLDSARKLNIKEDWLESGHVGLMQIKDWDRIKYVDRDENGNWINRYVLASASPQQIRTSNYCLAPFNRSDAHKASEISDGCSWFRMAEPSIEGLKQVACEPKTRIAREVPPSSNNNAILGMRVYGGYSDGQFFKFNDGLNCIVGQNYAGKSAVFDFIRFALSLEQEVDIKLRQNLLTRLNGILTPGGSVEVYVRHAGESYVIKRRFNPITRGEGADLVVVCCNDPPIAYQYDRGQDSLVRVENFHFPVEVYEQHRISRLRDDVARQLEMLDEFACIGTLKGKRALTIQSLNESARNLAPLYDECDQLRSEVGNLAQLEQELADKEKLVPGQEEQSWANTVTVIQRLEAVIDELTQATALIPDPSISRLNRTTELERLFAQSLPPPSAAPLLHPEVVSRIREAVRVALEKIEDSRKATVASIQELQRSVSSVKAEWAEKRQAHDDNLRAKLRAAGVESPQEIIDRVGVLRSQINTIKTNRQPRLIEVCSLIDHHETTRTGHLLQLESCNSEITAKRQAKAAELTKAVGEQIKISISANADTTEYKRVLDELCSEIVTKESRIQNREGQLQRVVAKLSPVQLARCLKEKDTVRLDDASEVNLQEFCNITENTENFLSRIADDIQRLNKLETAETPDVPEILVKRRGENAFADLRTGLSPGEQSAAILTLALQTRSMPLILDQPEDELGYNYVVHLIVPKILDAKFSRQLLVVTHNANIPVLGDADYVMKMENRPHAMTGRMCIVAGCGCFESSEVTKALVELEGGRRAFEFRQHRYAMPSHSK